MFLSSLHDLVNIVSMCVTNETQNNSETLTKEFHLQPIFDEITC